MLNFYLNFHCIIIRQKIDTGTESQVQMNEYSISQDTNCILQSFTIFSKIC